MIRIAFLCSALLLAAACGGQARVVRQTQTGGEIALEGDRDSAMKKAVQVMRHHCQGPYSIIEQGATAIGADRAPDDPSHVDEQGNAVDEGGESKPQATEWRVTYACGNGPSGPPIEAYSPAEGAEPAPSAASAEAAETAETAGSAEPSSVPPPADY